MSSSSACGPTPASSRPSCAPWASTSGPPRPRSRPSWSATSGRRWLSQTSSSRRGSSRRGSPTPPSPGARPGSGPSSPRSTPNRTWKRPWRPSPGPAGGWGSFPNRSRPPLLPWPTPRPGGGLLLSGGGKMAGEADEDPTGPHTDQDQHRDQHHQGPALAQEPAGPPAPPRAQDEGEAGCQEGEEERRLAQVAHGVAPLPKSASFGRALGGIRALQANIISRDEFPPTPHGTRGGTSCPPRVPPLFSRHSSTESRPEADAVMIL